MLGLTAVMAWKECKPAQVQDATGQGMKKKNHKLGRGTWSVKMAPQAAWQQGCDLGCKGDTKE